MEFLKKVLVVCLLFAMSGCAHFWRKVADTHEPYKALQHAGGLTKMRFFFRPDEKVKSLHLVGSFNEWSFPGNLKGGKIYQLKYDKKIKYWVVDVWMKPGLYYYLYVVNCRGTAVDQKNMVTNESGGQASRVKVPAG